MSNTWQSTLRVARTVALAAITIACYGAAFALHGVTVIETWIPVSVAVTIAAAANVWLCQRWRCVTRTGSRLTNYALGMVVMTGVAAAMLYGVNFMLADASSRRTEQATVECRHAETRHRTRRVGRRHVRQGEPYRVYSIDISLSSGRRKRLSVTLSQYNKIRTGESIPLTMEDGGLGFPVIRGVELKGFISPKTSKQTINIMKKSSICLIAAFACLSVSQPAMAQFNLSKAISGAAKATKALTLTDQQMAEYVKEYIEWMDTHNQVCAKDNPYTMRLAKLTKGLTNVEGTPLNFKVYYVKDVNAFACADGSVRVFSSLMDIMSDEELLGVIGHEVGHIAHKDSKKGFRTALLTAALKDGIASNGGRAAALTESQLGKLGDALVSATYSQKQEREADDYGYEFLKRAGKNPWAMALSFKKLKAMQEEAGAKKNSKLNQLFSTHPDLDARIKRMEERATAEGIKQPVAAK